MIEITNNDFFFRTIEDEQIIRNLKDKLLDVLYQSDKPLRVNITYIVQNFYMDYDELFKGLDDENIEATLHRYELYFNIKLINRLALISFIREQLPKGWPIPNTQEYSI